MRRTGDARMVQQLVRLLKVLEEEALEMPMLSPDGIKRFKGE